MAIKPASTAPAVTAPVVLPRPTHGVLTIAKTVIAARKRYDDAPMGESLDDKVQAALQRIDKTDKTLIRLNKGDKVGIRALVLLKTAHGRAPKAMPATIKTGILKDDAHAVCVCREWAMVALALETLASMA